MPADDVLSKPGVNRGIGQFRLFCISLKPDTSRDLWKADVCATGNAFHDKELGAFLQCEQSVFGSAFKKAEESLNFFRPASDKP